MKIGKYDVIYTNLEENCGKITIIDENEYKYSYQWGAMGGTIEQFLKQIDSEYFAKNLLQADEHYSTNWRKTFRNIREYIRDEIGLKWYEHMEFQTHLRQNLNDFQERCIEQNDENYFVNYFHKYVGNYLDYSLIDDHYDAEELENDFKNISEVWYFLNKKPSQKYKDFTKLHKTLVKKLIKLETKSTKFLSKIK